MLTESILANIRWAYWPNDGWEEEIWDAQKWLESHDVDVIYIWANGELHYAS